MAACLCCRFFDWDDVPEWVGGEYKQWLKTPEVCGTLAHKYLCAGALKFVGVRRLR